MIWLGITSLFSLMSHVCGQNFDATRLRFFPAVNQSIAGVFQVSSLNDLGQPHYAFNASEARQLCLSLGVTIAGKAQVEEALTRGLDTCRYGWIDEHLAVIPRIKALSNCGQNRTGLVTWRTYVREKFDVFCFNESDAAAQLEDATTGSPLSSVHDSEQTASTQAAQSTSFSSRHPPSSSTTLKTIDTEWDPAPHVGSTHSSARGKAMLITSTCILLLIAVIVVVYLKMKKTCARGLDLQQQQQGESTETQDWKSGEDLKENTSDTEGDEKIEVVEMESHVTD